MKPKKERRNTKVKTDFGNNPLEETQRQPSSISDHYTLKTFNPEKELQTSNADKELEELKKQTTRKANDVGSMGSDATEKQIKGDCKAVKKPLVSDLTETKSDIDKVQNQTEKELAEKTKEEREAHYKPICDRELREKKQQAQNEKIGLHNGDAAITRRDEKIQDLKDKKEEFIVKRLNGSIPVANFLKSLWVYIFIIFGLTSIDAIANFGAIQALEGLINIMIIPMTLAISCCLALSAHFAGKHLDRIRNKDFLFPFSFGIFFLAVITFLRWNMNGGLVFIIMNLGFYTVCAYLSHLRTVLSILYVFDIEIEKLAVENAKANTFQAQEYNRIDNELEMLDVDYKDMHVRRAAQDISILEANIQSCINIKGLIDERITYISDTVKDIEEGALNRCKVLAERRAVSKSASNITADLIKKARTNLNGLGMAAFFLFLTVSCSNEPFKEATLLVDITREENTIPDPKMAFSHFREMKHGKINITVISDLGINPVYPVHCEKEESYLFRVEKEADAKKARYPADFDKTYQKVLSLAKQPNNYKYSAVYENIIRHTILLNASKASQKQIVAYSDMLHHTKQVSFYKYRSNPSKLLEEDYDSIVKKLEAGVENPESIVSKGDLSITIIFQPDQKDDALFRVAMLFWKKYFSTKNISIRFEPNTEALVASVSV